MPLQNTSYLHCNSNLNLQDYFDHLKSRVSAYRMKCNVEPGLYALGSPTAESMVFVTANYKLSFDRLRRELGRSANTKNAWILVLNTRGINVWCAAGKGTFGTYELIKRIESSELTKYVSHRKLILPQLGAIGIAAHRIQKETGFRVIYGPVDVKDLPWFIDQYLLQTEKTKEHQIKLNKIRLVKFTLLDRLILTPMEWIPALKKTFFPMIALLVLSYCLYGVHTSLTLFLLFQLTLFTGAVLAPLLLPWIPFKSFAMKGAIMGLGMFAAYYLLLGFPHQKSIGLFVSTAVFFPLYCSYLVLLFTGSTPFTNMSGVKLEVKYALPIYRVGLVVAAVLYLLGGALQWIL